MHSSILTTLLLPLLLSSILAAPTPTTHPNANTNNLAARQLEYGPNNPLPDLSCGDLEEEPPCPTAATYWCGADVSAEQCQANQVAEYGPAAERLMARQDRDVLAEDHLAPSSDSSGCGLGISTEDCYANQALASEAIAVGEGEDNALMAV